MKSKMQQDFAHSQRNLRDIMTNVGYSGNKVMGSRIRRFLDADEERQRRIAEMTDRAERKDPLT